MKRRTFLLVVSVIAMSVGAFALFLPSALLESKGVAPSEAANVWAREVGVAIFSVGLVALLLRGHEDSPTLRAFLIGNALLQIGLFPIEILAYVHGVITKASGIVPNSILHLVLAAGFAYFASKMSAPHGAVKAAE